MVWAICLDWLRLDLASRPSSSPLVSLCGPFDFPRIGLRADVVRRFCQLILLRHSLAVGRIVFPFVSSFVSLARLVGRLVIILCGSLANPFHLVDLPVSRCSVSLGGPSLVPPSCSSFLGILSCPAYRLPSFRPASRQAVRVLSFRLGGSSRRLVWRGVSSVIRLSFRSLSVLVSSHSLPFHGHGDGGSSCPLSRGGVALAEWSCRSTIRETHRFCQLDFLPSG